MTEYLKENLDQLIGKTKVYLGKTIKISKYKTVNETIVVFTDARTYTFTHMEIDDFFKQLKDVEDKKPKNKSLPQTINTSDIVINGYQPSAENKEIKSSLMEVLKAIKTNPDEQTLKKARAVCDVANTMVNIQKAEIQLINAVKRK